MQPISDAPSGGPPLLDLDVAKAWPVAAFVAVITLGLGVVVMVWPSQTLTVLAVLLGLQLLLFGIFRLINSFSSDVRSPGLLAFVGILGMVGGVVVLRHPFETVVVLATLLGVVWVVGGGIELMTAVVDGSHGDRWLMLFSGLLSVATGVIVIAWPAPTVTVVAWISGIYLVLSGILIGMAALRLRSAAT
jgi:uncharacterized membrane protein HdeD (DUF308 family)